MLQTDTFDWHALYSQRFLLIPTNPVFTDCSIRAYDSRFSPFLRAAAQAKLGTCPVLEVLYTANRDVEYIFDKITFRQCSQLSLLANSPALLDVIRQLDSLTVVVERECNAAQTLVDFGHSESIHCAAFASVDLSAVFWVYYDFTCDAATTPL